MTDTACLKCGFINTHQATETPESCPKCGAIYKKVEAAFAAKQEAAAKAAVEKAEKDAWEAKANEIRAAAREDIARKSAQSAVEREREKTLALAVCMACGHVGKPKKKPNGSLGAEAALWLLGLFLTVTIIFLGFGLLTLFVAFCYSLWRAFSRRHVVCAKCGSESVIPGDSPRGREELARQELLPPVTN